jgi:hypothetical protein
VANFGQLRPNLANIASAHANLDRRASRTRPDFHGISTTKRPDLHGTSTANEPAHTRHESCVKPLAPRPHVHWRARSIMSDRIFSTERGPAKHGRRLRPLTSISSLLLDGLLASCVFAVDGNTPNQFRGGAVQLGSPPVDTANDSWWPSC